MSKPLKDVYNEEFLRQFSEKVHGREAAYAIIKLKEESKEIDI